MNKNDENPQDPLHQLLDQHREQLRMMISLRMDPRVRARFDPSDVVQETYLEASRRYDDYMQNPKQTPYVWLRFLAYQQLLIAHRTHMRVKARDARREVVERLGISHEGILDFLANSLTSPSDAAARAEEASRLHQILSRMDDEEREILMMKHFEQITNQQIGEALGISVSTVSRRYMQALEHLSNDPLMNLSRLVE